MDRMLRNTNRIRSVDIGHSGSRFLDCTKFGSSDVPGGCDQILQMRREMAADLIRSISAGKAPGTVRFITSLLSST